MIPRILSILIALCITAAPLFVRAADQGGEPEALLPETVYEFQPVVEGSEVVHEFVIQNRGRAELSVLKLKSG